MASANLEIKIPTKTYVAFKKNSGHLPYGHMTYDGNDAAAEKRRQRMNTHAYYRDRKEGELPAKSFDNKPMSGFKFVNVTKVTHGWGKGDTYWTVEDPRGFELSLSGQNVVKIMACSTIENGEIIDKCVWGHIGSENILIPVSSDIYQSAVTNTERVSKRENLRSVGLGSKVLTHDGLTGIYMGAFYTVEKGYGYNAHIYRTNKKRYVLLVDGESGQEIHVTTAVKISEVLDSQKLTDEESERQVNDALGNGARTKSTGYHSYYGFVRKADDSFKVTIRREPIDFSEILSNSQDSYGNNILVRHEGYGEWGLGSAMSLRSLPAKNVSIAVLNIDELNNGKFVFKTEARSNSYSYGYGTTYQNQKHMDIPMTSTGEDCEFYKLILEIHTQSRIIPVRIRS